jgi:hypothetical protein
MFGRENSDNVNFIAVVPEIRFFYTAFFLCPIGMAIRVSNPFTHIAVVMEISLPKMMALNICTIY